MRGAATLFLAFVLARRPACLKASLIGIVLHLLNCVPRNIGQVQCVSAALLLLLFVVTMTRFEPIF